MKNGQLKAGILLSYISQAVQILITILYTPVMLHLLGQSEYGIYQIVFSVVSFLSLMTFGFNGSYNKFFAKAINAEDKERSVSRLNGTYFLVFSTLAAIVLILGLIMAANTETILGGKMTTSELSTAKVLMYILVFNSSLNFIVVTFNNYILANEKFVAAQVINLITIIINPCLTFPLLLMGYASIGLGVALLAITILRLILCMCYCYRKLSISFSFRKLQKGLFYDIGIFSFYIFLEQVITLLNNNVDRFLLGKFAGSVEAAIYAVGAQINTLYTMISVTISSVFSPRINIMVEQGGKDKAISDLFIRIGKIQFVILYGVLVGFVIFGQKFMQLWVGDSYSVSYYVALILLVPNTINLIQSLAYEIQRAKGMQKYRSYLWFGIAVMNVVVSIFLIKLWGARGAALGTALAWIVGSGFVMNWFYAKYVGLDIVKFWKEILFMGKGAIPLFVIGYFIHDYIQTLPLLTFVISLIIFTIVYAVCIYCLGLHSDERREAKNYMANILTKLNKR